MNNRKQNPITEYLLKLQMIVTNTEFKDKAEARKYETLETKLNGEAYCRAINKTDIFESYEYDPQKIYSMLAYDGYSESQILKYLHDTTFLPQKYKNKLLEEAREYLIQTYEEPNNYYRMLNGLPNVNEKPITIPDEFYQLYKSDYLIYRDQPIHELPNKYLELFINSEYYSQTMKKYPDARYLKYIGSNKIDIYTSRSARDGDIMKINVDKLSRYHETFGHVTVSPDIIHAYVSIYNETRDYVYYTLRGNFSEIYANYDSFMRFLTIYLSIGNALNEFMKKSTKMIYMNNTTANNLFMLYGLPSVIMTGSSMIDFLKKFRLLLMDKGTNIVYRVKDLIGYEYTDIYTLIMVKQQVYENGMPIYHYESDGSRTPVQRIVFRRFGTTDDNTSYFKFREERKEYSLEEITSGDPRWWNTPEVEKILQEANYTLSNSKYIQLSTTVSMTDIWWECVILLRGLLDRRQETAYTDIDINFNANGSSTMRLFDAVLVLIILMNWQLKDVFGNGFTGDMYIPNGIYCGKQACLDLMFNGLYMANVYQSNIQYKIGDVIGLQDSNSEYNATYQYEDAFFMNHIYIATKDFVSSTFESDIANGNLIEKEYWDEASPKELILGSPYKIASFNFDIRSTDKDFYDSIVEMEYLEPDIFLPMLEDVLNLKNNNVGSVLMTDAKMIYKYLEQKLQQCTTIHEFRQVTDVFNHLFLVDPVRNWTSEKMLDIEKTICDYFGITSMDYHAFQMFVYKENNEPDYYVHFGGKDYPISIYQILTQDVYHLQILDSYPFQDNNFVNEFETATMNYYSNGITNASSPTVIMEGNNVIETSTLASVIKEKYQEIIVYKVKLELGNTENGPTSFETLLMRENTSLYNYLIELRKTPESLLLFLRAIIKGLESYTNTTLSGLQFKALGVDNYFYILKEVISYFKSYMVEFTKEEFKYLFDGLFDQGGNSNMLKLMDEMTAGTNMILPKDSGTLYDVSCAKVYTKMHDDNTFHIYDDAIIRLKTIYEKIKETGYEIWFDNGKRITQTKPNYLTDDMEVIANIVSPDGVTYKIIIPLENINTGNHYGTMRP